MPDPGLEGPGLSGDRRPSAASWREHAIVCVAELRTLTAWLRPRSQEPGADGLVAAIDRHLDDAERAAAGPTTRERWTARLLAWVGGIPVDRVMTNLDAAEADLLRLAPAEYLRGQMPGLLARLRLHLPGDDPRRVHVEGLARRTKEAPQQVERDAVVTAVHAANAEARREVTRVRSFRNVLLVTATALILAMVGIGLLGAARPDAVPLCFTPGDKVVCPTKENPVPPGADVDEVIAATTTSWDVPLVEAVGLIAAALAAAASLRGIKGSSMPYSLPVALAVLKLPTGALTALLGLLLMRGEFVPGLSALDFPAQILAWAVVFGYAQQLFTRFVDQRAQDVLDEVGGGSHTPEVT